MTHGPQQGMGAGGAAVLDFMDQMRRSSGDAVRAGIQGDYEQFGGMLGDAMGPGIAAKGLLAAGTALGPAWLLKKMWGRPEQVAKKVAKNVIKPKRVAGGPQASLRGPSKHPTIDDAMKYAQENNVSLRTADQILSKQWLAGEYDKLTNMNQAAITKSQAITGLAPEIKPPPLGQILGRMDRPVLGQGFKRQRGKLGTGKPPERGQGGLLAY
ncbi:MAG: hypothetical protein KJN90_06500 [Gammaproteobacteria bacterium]|nr:hypothetical protein [Gammaproteobacteria bacterium]